MLWTFYHGKEEFHVASNLPEYILRENQYKKACHCKQWWSCQQLAGTALANGPLSMLKQGGPQMKKKVRKKVAKKGLSRRKGDEIDL